LWFIKEAIGGDAVLRLHGSALQVVLVKKPVNLEGISAVVRQLLGSPPSSVFHHEALRKVLRKTRGGA
jgi:hypothetical protein